MTFFFDTIVLYIIERLVIVIMGDGKIKKVTITILVICILVMSFAYANLFEQLMINGNASVTASWKIEITGIKEGDKTLGAYSVGIPSYTVSTATFNAKLSSSSDSIEYLVTVRNSGEIDAKLDSIITSKSGSDAIIYEIIGVNEGDIIKKGETATVTIKVSTGNGFVFDETANESTSMTIIFNYIQSV